MRGSRYNFHISPRSGRASRRLRSAIKMARLTLVFGIPFVVLGVFLYLLLFSRAFAIDYIDVSVEGAIDPTQVRAYLFSQMEKNRLFFFSEKNLLAFNAREADRILRDAFVINTLSISKSPPNKLRVTLSGKPFRALWFSGGALYEITTRGTIAHSVDSGQIPFLPRSLRAKLSRVASSTPPLARTEAAAYTASEEAVQVPILLDEGSSTVNPGDLVLSEQELSAVLGFSKAAHDAGVHYDYMKAVRGNSDVRIVTNEGWEILATNTRSPSDQMDALSRVIREKIKDERKKIRYVDVRFQNRVYYQ